MILLASMNDWKLVTFDGAGSSYKIINKYKCYYETQQKKRAINKFNELTKGAVT